MRYLIRQIGPWFYLLSSLCFCHYSMANELEPLLEQAFSAYSQAQQASDRTSRLAHFNQAEKLFAKISQHTQTADLYYNLGTAALQAEHLGQAILAYRRALQLDPNHQRAQQNLNHARSLLPTWVPRPEQKTALNDFFFWQSLLSNHEKQILAAFCFLISSTLIAIGLRWQLTVLRSLAILPALLWIALILSLAIEQFQTKKPLGVLTAVETIARAADSVNAPQRFTKPLPAGTEISVLEQRDHWLRINLANDREVWIQDSHMTLINLDQTTRI